ncbi:MAG: alanine--tRNA ligase [Pseudomonadota bacterium]
MEDYSIAGLRSMFLDYFQSNQHTLVRSSPVIPANDPTLLFTNAGMVQFKETFLGLEKRAYHRATSSQRCIRAGGKHNDLDNVGYTQRHHTFFEMLGNFSFGDYFKQDAIRFAWEFITEHLKLPPERLWVTVYEEDEEAERIWQNDIGFPAERMTRCGEKDNFWSMGDTGPCGPCSEIFYDHGPEVFGGPPGSPDEDGDRYTEIWNLVFMQYDRDTSGTLTPLPAPSVDTGMGLERLAAVMQGVHSNYETDLFVDLLNFISDMAGEKDTTNPSMRVIADHIRSCAFMIVDGIVPNNEGRGYVLRRIIRRAIRHGHKLGLRESFFHALVEPLDRLMGEAYPELRNVKDVITRVLKQEEERFAETLDQGMRILEQAIEELSDTQIPGEVAFKLYDTYGFPVDLTADIARERDLTVDTGGFEQALEAQRSRSRAASRFEGDWSEDENAPTEKTDFTGYEHLEDASAISALFKDNAPVEALKAGEQGRIVLEKTPFYAESGGQVGDQGTLIKVGESAVFEVEDTQKMGSAHAHIGMLKSGDIHIGDTLQAKVDQQARASTARNHSATHLMHAALRNTLGAHVQQKGSLVAPDRLRFDFSHFEPISKETLQQIERAVNSQILGNTSVETKLMDLEEAIDSGAMALFGEKYDEQVRVLAMGDDRFSVELCGGTHVGQVGDIGLFKIINETGVAAGVRRIEAITGEGALVWVENAESRLDRISGILKADANQLENRVTQLLDQIKQQEKELEQLQAKLASNQSGDLVSQAVEVHGIKVLATQIDNVDGKRLREMLDQLKDKLGNAAIVLAAVNGSKISLIAGVNQVDKLHAGNLLKHVASQVGGKGGGRPDMAQGGGSEPDKLPGALASVTDWVTEQL